MDPAKYERIFLDEAGRHLRELDELLAAAEKTHVDPETWTAVHGRIHSIKGMAAALGHARISELSHRLEAFCERLSRGGEAPAGAVRALLEGMDVIKSLVAAKDDIEHGDLQERCRTVVESLSRPAGSSGTEAGGEAQEAGSVPQVAPIRHVRVTYELIDELLGLSQEILSAERNLPAADARRLPPSVRSWIGHHSSMLKVLYYRLMDLRLVSVGDFAGMFCELIRNQAAAQGKTVVFEVVGEDVRADIALLNRLREPIVHLIRNAVAHGLEPAEERSACGKDPSGRLYIEASRRRDRLFITIGDDGRGIDRTAIADYLLNARGMSLERIEKMPGQEQLSVICEPEFSTAAEATDLAGRGIGMHVVAERVQSLGGSLSISSEPSLGTRFTMELPVALSVLHAVTFTVGGCTLSVPAAGIDSVERSRPGTSIDPASGVVDLGALLGIPPGKGEAYILKLRNDDARDILQSGPLSLLVHADAIVGNGPVVAMPAGKFLRTAGFYSGVGVMEDGTLSLILDLDRFYRGSGGSAGTSAGGADFPAAVPPGGSDEVPREGRPADVPDQEAPQ